MEDKAIDVRRIQNLQREVRISEDGEEYVAWRAMGALFGLLGNVYLEKHESNMCELAYQLGIESGRDEILESQLKTVMD